MKRKTTTAPTRIYSFGCSHRGITSNAALVEDQYRKAHAYQQKLVELEMRRRTAVRAVLGSASDVAGLVEIVSAHEKTLTADLAAASAIKQSTRSKKLPPELYERLAQTKKDLRAARDAVKAAKKIATGDSAIKTALANTTTEHAAAVKAARAASGCYWGSYLVLEKAAEQQRKEKYDPRPRGYTGEGRLAVQFQGGAAVAAVFGGTSRLMQLERKVDSKKRHICKLRIGSTDTGAPIWTEIEVFVHRPLPLDSRIMWAWLQRIRRGRDFVYNLQITLESETFVGSPPEGARPHRRIAVDLGWRVADKGAGGLRVAYWRDSNGEHAEVRVPPEMLRQLDYPAQLIGVETNWFERAKKDLLAWQAGVVLPEKHTLRLATLAQWKSASRLSSYVWWWREHRFVGDETIFAAMDEWRVRRFWHYRDWSMHQRDKALAMRKDFYQCAAKQLMIDCKELMLEKLDLRVFSKKDDDPSIIRYWKMQGAPSELRLCLIEQAKKVGAKITFVNPAMTTQRCNACGSELPWDAAPTVMHTCAICGATWDQDNNAAINILAGGPAVPEVPEALAHGND